MTMRASYFTVLAFLLCDFAAAATPTGTIRGLAWSGPVSALGAATMVDGDGTLKCYKKRNDDLAVGAATLTSITYCYYKNQLTSVLMKYSGYTNFDDLKISLSQKYGAPRQPNQFLDTYQWFLTKLFIKFDYSQTVNAGQVIYMYVPLMKEQDRDVAQQQKKDADKL
jgi:hypothetical protein